MTGADWSCGPRVVLVAAGKGGVGTSTTAALLALSFAEQGRRTLLIDSDDAHGTQHRWFGVCPEVGIGVLLHSSRAPEAAIIEATALLHLIPGGGTPVGLAAPSAASHRALWHRLATLYASYDMIVVDGGSRLDTIFAVCHTGVRRVVAVSDADPVSLASTFGLLKAVDALSPGLPVDFVANGQEERRARLLFDRLHLLTDRSLHRDVGYGGTIPEDIPLRNWLAEGGTFAGLAPHTPAVSAAVSCGGRLLSQLEDLPYRHAAPFSGEKPASIAVALRYDPLSAPAPVVVAVGQRLVADQIRRIAFSNGVPVLENAPLARALLNSTHTGQKIPAELYASVAEVLAFVIRQRALATLRWKGTATA